MVIPKQATWVRFPRFVGDAVMQMHILRLLRQMGVGPLVVWGPKSTVSLVADTDLCDAVLYDQGKPGPLELARILRQHGAARSIHFPKSLRPALGAWLARVPERIGVSESLAGLFNTHSGPFWSAGGLFLTRYHAILAQRWPDLPALPFADYDPGLVVDHPKEPYLCLMPGSIWPSKMWPAAHFRALLLRARAEGFQVAVLGAPDEAATCEAVAGDEGLNLCGRTNLKEAAAWLRAAAGAVGNDSGLCHLAAACGTPVLALFGPTDPSHCGAWGPKSRVLQREEVPCAPCYKRHCFTPGQPCLMDISPERVWAELGPLISV